MGITKREIASELGVSKRTVANYIEKLGLGNHVSRNGNTDFLDDFAAAAIADALKNPPANRPASQPTRPLHPPRTLVDSLAAQLEIERSRNAELMEALAAERDRAARAEAEAKAQLAEANARVAELAGKLASLAERQQAIAATPWWRRGRMAMKLLGPGRQE
jgi:DNA-binding transcriptional regulator LsrR (DeoR family)